LYLIWENNYIVVVAQLLLKDILIARTAGMPLLL